MVSALDVTSVSRNKGLRASIMRRRWQGGREHGCSGPSLSWEGGFFHLNFSTCQRSLEEPNSRVPEVPWRGTLTPPTSLEGLFLRCIAA